MSRYESSVGTGSNHQTHFPASTEGVYERGVVLRGGERKHQSDSSRQRERVGGLEEQRRNRLDGEKDDLNSDLERWAV